MTAYYSNLNLEESNQYNVVYHRAGHFPIATHRKVELGSPQRVN